MANRYFRQFMASPEPAVVKVFGKVTFGSSGAPTLVTASSKGIKSIVRNSAGKYTITLGTVGLQTDTYNALLNVQHLFDASGNSGTAPAAPEMFLLANSVASAGTLQIEFAAAGVSTDPANLEAVYLEITLKNSSAF